MQKPTWHRNYSLPNSYYYPRGNTPDFDDSSSYYSAPPTPPLISCASSFTSSSSDDLSSVDVNVDQFFDRFGLESDEADYFAELDLSEFVANLELVLKDHAQPGLRSQRDAYHTKQDLLAELGRLERVFRRMDKAGVAADDMGETLKEAREYVVKLTTTYTPDYLAEPELDRSQLVPPPAPRPDLNKPLPALPHEAIQPPTRPAVKRHRRKTPVPPVPVLPKVAVQQVLPAPRRKVARKPVVMRFDANYQPLINVC